MWMEPALMLGLLTRATDMKRTRIAILGAGPAGVGAAWQLVKQGVGIGGITKDIGDAEPLVCRILPDMPPIIVPMWLATHRELNKSKRVRTVFDFLVAELSRKPSQDAAPAAGHSITL